MQYVYLKLNELLINFARLNTSLNIIQEYNFMFNMKQQNFHCEQSLITYYSNTRCPNTVSFPFTKFHVAFFRIHVRESFTLSCVQSRCITTLKGSFVSIHFTARVCQVPFHQHTKQNRFLVKLCLQYVVVRQNIFKRLFTFDLPLI